jgi:hypothetical protein
LSWILTTSRCGSHAAGAAPTFLFAAGRAARGVTEHRTPLPPDELSAELV